MVKELVYVAKVLPLCICTQSIIIMVSFNFSKHTDDDDDGGGAAAADDDDKWHLFELNVQ